MGGERQIVHAQVRARGFYEKMGFIAEGDVYQDAGIPHITMVHEGDVEGCCVG
jgi:predicted GNAT family N-acyltransferase